MDNKHYIFNRNFLFKSQDFWPNASILDGPLIFTRLAAFKGHPISFFRTVQFRLDISIGKCDFPMIHTMNFKE